MSNDGYRIFIPEWRVRLALLAFLALVAYCAFIELQKSREAVEGMEHAMRTQFDDVEPRQSPSASVVTHHSLGDDAEDAEEQSETAENRVTEDAS